MAWSARAGRMVRYRTAAGRVHPAILTSAGALANQWNLRVGNGATKLSVTDANKVTPRTAGAGWYHSGR